MKFNFRIIATTLLLVFTLGNIVNAAIDFRAVEEDELYVSLEAMSKELNTKVFQTGTMDVDLRDLPSKTSSKTINPKNPPKVILRSNPTNTSKITCTKYIPTTYSRAIATSTSTTTEDEIYASARVYNSSGSLLADDDNRYNNTSFASATATAHGYEGYGNHEYYLAGYNDVIHSTHGYF